MARVLNAKYRNCEIASSGPVAALGNINAPIRRCKLTSEQIVSVLKQGFVVYEYNPTNPNEKEELTLTNNGRSPFIGAVAKEEPKKEDPIIEPVNLDAETTSIEKEVEIDETEKVPEEDVVAETTASEEVATEKVPEEEVVTEEQSAVDTPIVIETDAKKENVPTEKPAQNGPDFTKNKNKKKK